MAGARSQSGVVILGVFVADTSYRADRAPRMGETILGNSFTLGPGGKGSNQSVAAARSGARVTFLTRLGKDPFADMAMTTWRDAGVTPAVIASADTYTGAAYIFIEEASGDNAIIICPGAAAAISADDADGWREQMESAAVFVTQLEQPLPAALRALEIARAAGVTTILNPAPAAPLPDGMLALCDYLTPNETEAEALTGISVKTTDDARRAADALLAEGVGCAVITLGERGALIHDGTLSELVPAFNAGPVVETTGAGDAFNGAMAAALARGLLPLEAVRYGCAAGSVSVTRPGAAASAPTLADVEALLSRATLHRVRG